MVVQSFSQKQLETFQQADARINIFEGPVRSGKTFTSFLAFLEHCRSGPPGALVMTGRNDNTIKRNLITPLKELVGSALYHSIGKREVILYNRIIHVIGANDERAVTKIQGAEFAGALLDEVTLLPESFFKMLLSRLSIPNSKLFGTTNPDSPYHWLKRDYIDRASELDLKTFKYTMTDNPSLSQEYIDNISKEYTGLWHRRYILGEWAVAEGAVFDFFNEDEHCIEYQPHPATYYIIGIDYGTTNPTAFTMIGYNPGVYPNLWLEKEYYWDSTKQLRQKSDYEYVQDLIDFKEGYNIRNIYLDPAAASLKTEIRRHGINNCVDAVNDVVPGIRFVSQLLTNGTFRVYKSCLNTIKEFYNYMWNPKSTDRGLDEPIKKWDHALDSIRYALYTHFGRKTIQNDFTESDILKWERMFL